jgi:hypothetical protein
MKLQRTFITIAGVFFAVGFGASQAGAGCCDLPGCTSPESAVIMEIEVNALRAGGKTVSAGPNQTRNVTAKARILKGTALSGTTIDMTLTIEAIDGEDVISTNSTGPITLGVGKGGNGAKLELAIPQCNSGFITFVATFFGTDEDGDFCEGTRPLRKECK